MALVKTSRQKL